jgi:hypothetical protein
MIAANHIPNIIVSYRNPPDVRECLQALQNSAEDPAFDIYFCENGGPTAFGAPLRRRAPARRSAQRSRRGRSPVICASSNFSPADLLGLARLSRRRYPL